MPLWFADVAILIALLVTSELMFRSGRRSRRRGDENTKSQINAAQASALGLLALMLGFTLSMAESRFNARRSIMVEEANAIGTTYLRAAYLPEPYRAPARQLLRDYVQSRRAFYRASVSEAPGTTARTEEIQHHLWDGVVAMAPTYLDSDVIALYIDSVNHMIDSSAAREVYVAARVPWTISFLVIVISIAAVGITGYACGLGGGRVPVTVGLLPALIGLALAIIADLDRSREGYINTGDLPMILLERSMLEEQAAQRP
jgi:ABC-type multidrug transport system fused ATPase/permease subunit